ncbi:MAG: phosphatase PAP2 family protein [Bacteroidales bacterium]|nr:phosphatase PAP2 family protein [Bacteroidales bacterium]
MIEYLLPTDQSIFLFFNGLHSSWADVFFYWVSNRFIWIPFYAVLAFFLIKKWRKKSIPIFIALILCIFLTDQSCNLIKHSVQRPRPSHDPVLSEQVHLVAKPDGTLYKGGPYGFPSSHAANSMALALWVILYLGEKRKWLIIIMLCWVLLLSYSRIYLGVHYPSDLMVGWILGACWALVLWRGEQWLQNSKFRIQNS